jgi:dTDP-4-amino-4,6-dideoxygalactose transaminase
LGVSFVRTDTRRIAVCDLKRHYEAVQPEIDAAVQRVMASGWYVLGAEVEAFERAFAAYLGVQHVVGVANGTDALTLACLAIGAGPGDEVITVSNTATPTAMGITAAGATPVFCEIEDETFNMDPAFLESLIGSRTKAIMPVHLYGQAARMDAVLAIAEKHGLPVIEDVAQAHGATIGGRMLGSLGAIGCFSFYPTKNLGGLGDGGACVTNDDDLADRLRLLRNYGQRTRYDHEILGRNSRLDELQAAILRAMLPHLEEWTERRRAIATRYDAGFAELEAAGLVRRPVEADGNRHVYHLYQVRVADREALRAALGEAGIDTQVHYPIPVHLQQAYAPLGGRPGQLPVTEQHARETVSLPMFPELTDEEVDRVVDAVRGFFGVG